MTVGNKDIGEVVRDIVKMTRDLPNIRTLILKDKIFANIVYLDGKATMLVDTKKTDIIPFTEEGVNYIINLYNDFIITYNIYHISRQLTPQIGFEPYKEAYQ